MIIERDLIISVLKLTAKGSATLESINKDAKVPHSIAVKLLKKLQSDNLIYLKGDSIEVQSESRLRLAVKAVELGVDVERMSDFLKWQEFEGIAALALERNGYAVAKNVRFRHAGRKWEIDVVGCRKPLVICIDCKHWHHGMHPATVRKMVKAQAERVQAFSETLPSVSLEIECTRWERAKLIPVILSLISGGFKFHQAVPIVPVLQLQDFLSQLPAYVESVKYFAKGFSHL